jgi:hypothetical protein
MTSPIILNHPRLRKPALVCPPLPGPNPTHHTGGPGALSYSERWWLSLPWPIQSGCSLPSVGISLGIFALTQRQIYKHEVVIEKTTFSEGF